MKSTEVLILSVLYNSLMLKMTIIVCKLMHEFRDLAKAGKKG